MNSLNFLVTRDLLPRIQYGVKVSSPEGGVYEVISVSRDGFVFLAKSPLRGYEANKIKPYLFPLSSMTEKQYQEFNSLTDSVRIDGIPGHCNDYILPVVCSKCARDFGGNYFNVDTSLEDYLICLDWLHSHHFDYMDLIDEGLAIDATDLGIYGSNR